MKKKRYTESELRYIRENYGRMTLTELAVRLGRGKHALRYKLYAMHIPKADCSHRMAEERATGKRKHLLRFPRNYLLTNPGWRR